MFVLNPDESVTDAMSFVTLFSVRLGIPTFSMRRDASTLYGMFV